MTFVKTIQKILAIEPDKIKQYNNVYYSSDGIKGDAAYIINKDTFLKYFNGYNIILIPAYRWKQPIEKQENTICVKTGWVGLIKRKL